jgi:hypothetical protein
MHGTKPAHPKEGSADSGYDTDTIEGERNGRIRRMTRSTPGWGVRPLPALVTCAFINGACFLKLRKLHPLCPLPALVTVMTIGCLRLRAARTESFAVPPFEARNEHPVVGGMGVRERPLAHGAPLATAKDGRAREHAVEQHLQSHAMPHGQWALGRCTAWECSVGGRATRSAGSGRRRGDVNGGTGHWALGMDCSRGVGMALGERSASRGATDTKPV